MKTKLSPIVLAVLFSALIIGCTNNPTDSNNIENKSADLAILDQPELNAASLNKYAFIDPSNSEILSLQFMREEEKLARDVYSVFYNKYKLLIFKNINKSETVHTNAIKYLINKYGISDPASNDQPGVFENVDLQNLYTQLINQGNVSAIEALKVGALIEEVDILDLVNQLEGEVDNQDIVFVYNNLKRGSENHLRAFVRNLSLNGIQYVPVHLDSAYYYNIIK